MAGFIFSAVSVAFLGVWGLQIRSLEKSRHNLVGTMLAEQYIEQAMESGYERVGDDTDDIPMELETRGADGTWTTIPVAYHVVVDEEQVGPEEDKLKKVEVTVTWEDSTKNGRIKLVTYLAGVF